jgi:hypothetical protein
MRSLISSVVVVAAAGALAACGGDDDAGDGESGSAASPAATASAVREVGETRDALRAALASYRQGDHAAAEEQVAEAYVSHFEEVEGPLETSDPALKERLEEAIGGDLRSAMRAKTAVSEVAAAVREVVADLDRAEAALR